MNGNLEVISININEDLAKDSLEGLLVESLNENIKKAQKVMAQRLQAMGGLSGLG